MTGVQTCTLPISTEAKPTEAKPTEPTKALSSVEETAKALEEENKKNKNTLSNILDKIKNIGIKAIRRDKGERVKKELTWYAIDESYLSELEKPSMPIYDIIGETEEGFVFYENGVKYTVDNKSTFEEMKRVAEKNYLDKSNVIDNYYSLTPKNVFNIKNKAHFDKLKAYLTKKYGTEKANSELENIFGSSEFDNNLTDDVFETIGVEMVSENRNPFKEIGFDAIQFKEGGKKLIAVFDPNVVKFADEIISEAYHKAKADGSNPELVKAVEELIGKPTEAQPKAEPTKTFEQVAQKSGITPKNLKDLYNINRELFGLNRVKAFASAIAMDRMIGAMAKRAGVTKEQMYGKLKFEKASEQELPQGVKMQVDAWHGSPYQFERFTTEKIGTGEGAQAFGWGLYFTDLESIAKNYAKQLSALNSKIFVDGKEQIIIPDHVLYIVKDILEANGGDIEKTISDAKDRKEGYVDYLEFSQSKKQYDKFDKAIKYLEKNKEKIKLVADRIVYKVSLHKGKSPSEYTWLEWDKNATSEQKKQIANGIPNLTENEKTIISKYFTDKGNLKSVYLGQEYKTILPKYEISLLKERLMKDESRIKGSEIYHQLEKYFGGFGAKTDFVKGENSKQASLFLLENGIDGVKYPAESISRGATSDTARGFNYVVFDENAVSIEEVIKFQKDANKARGAMMITLDGQAVIYALTDPNVSTPLHELAHVFEHYLSDAEKATIQSWAKTKGWTTETSEKFARGFEKYLAEGKAPTPALQKIFDKFKQWLTDIYNGITESEIDIELNDAMRDIYAQMLGTDVIKQTAKPEAVSKEGKTNKQNNEKIKIGRAHV